jgi:hypothetical protein
MTMTLAEFCAKDVKAQMVTMSQVLSTMKEMIVGGLRKKNEPKLKLRADSRRVHHRQHGPRGQGMATVVGPSPSASAPPPVGAVQKGTVFDTTFRHNPGVGVDVRVAAKQVTPNASLMIGMSASGSVGALQAPRSITTAGSGRIDYCVVSSDLGRFEERPPRGRLAAHTVCDGRHSPVFTRRSSRSRSLQ